MLILLLPLALPQDPPPVDEEAVIVIEDGYQELSLALKARLDYDFVDGFDNSTLSDDHELRRLRLIGDVKLGEHGKARVQFNHNDDSGRFIEAYVDWYGSGGTYRIGHFREPFGLNAHTSSGHLMTHERTAPAQAFTAGRNHGIAFGKTGDDWSVWGGYFANARKVFSNVGEGRSVSGRGTWQPIREEDRILHLGASTRFTDPNSDRIRFAARPGAHLADYAVSSGSVLARQALIANIELAYQNGPFLYESELYGTGINVKGPDSAPWGASVQASWFPGGEKRRYHEEKRVFTSPLVTNPVENGGRGAFELVSRWTRTDLDEGSMSGGTMEDLTLGVNWHASSHARLMVGYVDAQIENAPDIDGLIFRLHFEF